MFWLEYASAPPLQRILQGRLTILTEYKGRACSTQSSFYFLMLCLISRVLVLHLSDHQRLPEARTPCHVVTFQLIEGHSKRIIIPFIMADLPTNPQIIFQEAVLKSEKKNTQASRVIGRDIGT
jgi:hypothetical protein